MSRSSVITKWGCWVLLLSGILAAEGLLNFTLFADKSPSSLGSSAWLVDDGTRALLVDTSASGLSDNSVPNSVAEHVSSRGLSLEMVFITHGHPDHFSGLPALRGNFSSTPFYVGSAPVLAELLSLVAVINSSGGFPPSLAGFDWVDQIQVLPGDTIDVFPGNPIQVDADFSSGESFYFAVLWDAAGGNLLTGDLIYHLNHFYLGVAINTELLSSWKDDNLDTLVSRYSSASAIYPGHGPVATGLFNTARDAHDYLETFLTLLRTCHDGVPDPLTIVGQTLVRTYPSYAFPVIVSSNVPNNPAWQTEQEEWACSPASSVSLAFSLASSLFLVATVVSLF